MFHSLTETFAASNLEWSQYDQYCDEKNIQMWIVKETAEIQALFFYVLITFLAISVCDSLHFNVIDSSIRFYHFPLSDND